MFSVLDSLRVQLLRSARCSLLCARLALSVVMAAVTCRALLKEIRIAKGSGYRTTLLYKYVLEQFRRNQVTGAQLCRARAEALHAASSYLCLLMSTRLHLRLHEHYHARGERRPEEVAGLVGLRLPTQPGGKGWET